MKHAVLLFVFGVALAMTTNAFVILHPSNNVGRKSIRHWVSLQEQDNTNNNMESSSSLEDDDALIESVPQSQFVTLCQQFELSTAGGKRDMLQRLREHAAKQAASDEEIKGQRRQRVEQGFFDEDSSKERYEIAGGEIVEANEEDERGYFYFSIPKNDTEIKEEAKKKKKMKMKIPPPFIQNPPPPLGLEPNEKGERAFTSFTTTAQNDLTSMSSSQPNQDSTSLIGSTNTNKDLLSYDGKKKIPVELEKAKELVDELVRSLLFLSGAPAFQEEFTEGLQPLSESVEDKKFPTKGYRGFDPSQVDTGVLIASSKALRAGRGVVLDQVLSDYEIKAVGHDGYKADNKETGGGHYSQVVRVRAFLEGFRRAEVKRVGRETTTLLLDRMATEGIQGLDRMLTTMTKVTDDSGDVGELSDGTIDFLSDLIRDQERRIGDLKKRIPDELAEDTIEGGEDLLAGLWNVTNEKGQRIETLDPQNPRVQEALMATTEKTPPAAKKQPLPATAPERLLLLLKLLRDRIKVEAAYGGADNQQGRNLRALAYCIQFDRAWDREKYLNLEFGSSIDRLDSFLELVESSIEYAETTAAQLTPSKVELNIPKLQAILDKTRQIREKMSNMTP